MLLCWAAHCPRLGAPLLIIACHSAPETALSQTGTSSDTLHRRQALPGLFGTGHRAQIIVTAPPPPPPALTGHITVVAVMPTLAGSTPSEQCRSRLKPGWTVCISVARSTTRFCPPLQEGMTTHWGALGIRGLPCPHAHRPTRPPDSQLPRRNNQVDHAGILPPR